MLPVLAQLREQLRHFADETHTAWNVVSSGHRALDAILPAGGFRGGTLIEWLAAEHGVGATALAFQAAREAMRGGRPLVVVDQAGHFFPPALSMDFDRNHLLLVRTPRAVDADWACDQALRTSGMGAVLTWLDVCDERRLRRWQLAAERSGALGLIVRHLSHQPEACFSDVRMLVTSLGAEGRRVRLELLRTRQGRPGAVAEVSLDDDTHLMSATAASRRRAIAS